MDATSNPAPARARRRHSLLLAAVLVAGSPLAAVSAATRDVCPAGCTYATIQSAVDAAAAGDVIDIGAGTYVEAVEVNTPRLSLIGAGVGITTVDGPLTPFEFNAAADGAVLAGMTIQSRVDGGCVRSFAALTIRDARLEICVNEENGGGIYTRGDLVLERVTVLHGEARFTGNFPSQGRGGGLYVDGDPVEGGPVVRIYDSAFVANEALFGGGVYVGAGARVFVDGSYFDGNAARDTTTDGAVPDVGRGGAIRTFGELHVTFSTFTSNRAERNGGAIAVNSSYEPVRVATSVLVANFTDGDPAWLPLGGGVAVESYGGELRIVGSEISRNVSTDGAGVGVYELLQGGTVEIAASTVAENQAAGSGAGLYVYGLSGGEVTVRTSTLSSNVAGVTGGGAFGAAGSGTIHFRGATVVDNVAGTGGGGLEPGGAMLRNTVLAGNLPDDCAGAFDSEGGNLIGSGDGCAPQPQARPGDQIGTGASPIDPMLGPLVDPDGALLPGTGTPAHRPLPGSPVVDAAPQCPAVDQNGHGRPYDFASVLPALAGPAPRCDLGAIELDAGCGTPPRTGAMDPVDGAAAVGRTPLLVWEPTVAAVTYDVRISTVESPFRSAVVAEATGLTATHWQVPAALAPGQVHYWRVWAHTPCGGVSVSAVFSFTTG